MTPTVHAKYEYTDLIHAIIQGLDLSSSSLFFVQIWIIIRTIVKTLVYFLGLGISMEQRITVS